MANIIVDITQDSPAARAGIKRGEELVSVNGQRVVDVIDYQFFSAMTRLAIDTRDENGEIHHYKIRKPEWENLGLIFEDALMDSIRSCANNCIFCFIAQMPPNMRKTLYVKDDDWRMSLMMGNYITLTNVGPREFQRIIDRHVSPLYISVHATDGDVRCRMMNNKNAGDIMQRLRMLAENHIQFNCQIVLCPGFNDGEVLQKTLEDLYSLSPYAVSAAVVPVGMTKYREHLTHIDPVTPEKANEIIDMTEAFGKKTFEEKGTHFVFASDEMYMIANRPLPPYEYYEDFPQIDNGVGLCIQLVDEYEAARERYGKRAMKKKKTIATGKSIAPFLRKLIGENEMLDIVPIRNFFFGETITVAGLVTGGDLISQLKTRDLGDELLLPACMLRNEQDLFLDDVPFARVEEELHVKTSVVPVDGAALYRKIYDIEQEETDE